MRMPTASKPFSQTWPLRKVFIGGIGYGSPPRPRIRPARRPPDLLRLGIPRDADIACDLVVIGRDVLIRDRPVLCPAMLALDLEIVRQQAWKVGEVVQRGSADAPAPLETVTDRVPAFEDERAARGLHPPSPNVGADQ